MCMDPDYVRLVAIYVMKIRLCSTAITLHSPIGLLKKKVGLILRQIIVGGGARFIPNSAL